MTPPAKTPSAPGSVLQRSFALGELLDLDSFREVCVSYSSLFQIGFKIFDQTKELLVDVKGTGTDFCSYLFSHPGGKELCTREVTTIRDSAIPEGGPEYHNCFSGLRYMIAAITHEGDPIGKIVYGPYLPAEIAPPELSDLGQKFKTEVAARLIGKVRKVQDEVVRKVVHNLAQTIEVMLYIGYKNALTSRMHVEAVSASYSELQAKNQALQDSFERLKELDRLKSNFLATVSHELRTPLTSVIGYSEMLLEGLAGPLSEEQTEYLNTIMEKGEQLLGLITSILDFSKIELGSLRLNRTMVNVVDITRTAVTTIMPIARKTKVGIDFSSEGDLPSILVDGDKIRQVLINIIGNAVKFNRENGTVTVKVEVATLPAKPGREGDLPAALSPVDEDFVRITITDTGLGIPQDKLTRIFDSFYQVDGSSTREYGGTGLGLAIARSLVDAHEGHIEVTSEQNQGSTFTVLLPIVQED
jgi:two-component system, NarL family, sensor histidine kinase BarA